MLLNRLDLLVITVQFLTNGGVTPNKAYASPGQWRTDNH